MFPPRSCCSGKLFFSTDYVCISVTGSVTVDIRRTMVHCEPFVYVKLLFYQDTRSVQWCPASGPKIIFRKKGQDTSSMPLQSLLTCTWRWISGCRRNCTVASGSRRWRGSVARCPRPPSLPTSSPRLRLQHKTIQNNVTVNSSSASSGQGSLLRRLFRPAHCWPNGTLQTFPKNWRRFSTCRFITIFSFIVCEKNCYRTFIKCT